MSAQSHLHSEDPDPLSLVLRLEIWAAEKKLVTEILSTSCAGILISDLVQLIVSYCVDSMLHPCMERVVGPDPDSDCRGRSAPPKVGQPVPAKRIQFQYAKCLSIHNDEAFIIDKIALWKWNIKTSQFSPHHTSPPASALLARSY